MLHTLWRVSLSLYVFVFPVCQVYPGWLWSETMPAAPIPTAGPRYAFTRGMSLNWCLPTCTAPGGRCVSLSLILVLSRHLWLYEKITRYGSLGAARCTRCLCSVIGFRIHAACRLFLCSTRVWKLSCAMRDNPSAPVVVIVYILRIISEWFVTFCVMRAINMTRRWGQCQLEVSLIDGGSSDWITANCTSDDLTN